MFRGWFESSEISSCFEPTRHALVFKCFQSSPRPKCPSQPRGRSSCHFDHFAYQLSPLFECLIPGSRGNNGATTSPGLPPGRIAQSPGFWSATSAADKPRVNPLLLVLASCYYYYYHYCCDFLLPLVLSLIIIVSFFFFLLCLFVCLFVWFLCLFVCLLVCLYACLLVCLFACLLVCLFVCLSVCCVRIQHAYVSPRQPAHT